MAEPDTTRDKHRYEMRAIVRLADAAALLDLAAHALDALAWKDDRYAPHAKGAHAACARVRALALRVRETEGDADANCVAD